MHELGHFLLAKSFRIRVDEFAIGFPPRIIAKKFGETVYALNLVPFGGYVKIFGEDISDPSSAAVTAPDSFSAKNRLIQALVLVGGIVANILFAWVLLSVVFMIGAPVSAEQYSGSPLSNERLLILDVIPGSPAATAGIRAGDTIVSLSDGRSVVSDPSTALAQDFIAAHGEKTVTILLHRADRDESITVTPIQGLVSGKSAIGISMERVGNLQLSFFPALWEGAVRTVDLFIATGQAIGIFLYQTISFSADFSTISGPVGIVSMVGDARSLGWFYLLSFTALISLNLAVINLIPFPALDGGRLFFVLIEAVTRKRLPAKLMQTLNAIGFVILIAFLIFVTYKDILRLF